MPTKPTLLFGLLLPCLLSLPACQIAPHWTTLAGSDELYSWPHRVEVDAYAHDHYFQIHLPVEIPPEKPFDITLSTTAGTLTGICIDEPAYYEFREAWRASQHPNLPGPDDFLRSPDDPRWQAFLSPIEGDIHITGADGKVHAGHIHVQSTRTPAFRIHAAIERSWSPFKLKLL